MKTTTIMSNNLQEAMQALSRKQPTEAPPKKGQLMAAIQAFAEQNQQATQSMQRDLATINKDKLQASIKSERLAQGLTQRQLAVKCNMSQGTITRAERNGWISFSCLLRIAQGLGKEISLT